MPNWCSQDLRVTGEKEELQRFKQFATTGEDVLCERNFIPYPEEYLELDKKAEAWNKKADEFAKENGCDQWYCGDKLDDISRKMFVERNGDCPKDGFNLGGYEWCCQNWGSKWGICNPELVIENDKELVYTFESAWSPVCPVILKMSEMFPKLKFELKYYEIGMGFKGTYIVSNGMVEEDTEEKYGCECDKCWEECECDLRGG